ncbi:MAG: AbrB/MazE/SpoVT family DNA-binding domain-containing protein [Candidatus Diapherotrites archaeon]
MFDTVLSSKGQLVMPAEIRQLDNLKAGTRFSIQRTPNGYVFVPIPKNVVKALSGLTKDLNIPEDALKKMRIEDERIFRRKHLV